MRWGILLVALGIACYMVHAMLLNDFLRKNAPEVLARDPGVHSQRQRRVFLVVYLRPADKYPRLTHRPLQGQKGIYERALRASQRPSHPW